MATNFHFQWAMATWDNRAAAGTTYVEMDEPIGGNYCRLTGSPTRMLNFSSMNRLPVKVEVSGDTTYMTYHSYFGTVVANGETVKNRVVPIIKITRSN